MKQYPTNLQNAVYQITNTGGTFAQAKATFDLLLASEGISGSESIRESFNRAQEAHTECMESLRAYLEESISLDE